MRLHANSAPLPGLYRISWESDTKKAQSPSLKEQFLSPRGSAVIADDEFEHFLEKHCPQGDRLILSPPGLPQQEELLSLNHDSTQQLAQSAASPALVKVLKIKHHQGHITNLPEIQETLAPYLQCAPGNPFSTTEECDGKTKNRKGIHIPFPAGKQHLIGETQSPFITTVYPLAQLRSQLEGLIFNIEL